jgi:beta-alanine degradation protein BauB
MTACKWYYVIGCLAVLMISLPLAAQPPSDSPHSRSLSISANDIAWQQQTPNLPIMIGELWGDRRADGGFGELVRLPPGFNSGPHAHSGDFHGVLIKGAWIHEGPSGEGRDRPLLPGSYVRQAGGEMHIDRCVGEDPCVLFLFQYARADIIWPNRQ